MRMGQGLRTGLGHRGITCVLQTQFSSFWLELPLTRTNFHDRKPVGATEVLLYILKYELNPSTQKCCLTIKVANKQAR